MVTGMIKTRRNRKRKRTKRERKGNMRHREKASRKIDEKAKDLKIRNADKE